VADEARAVLSPRRYRRLLDTRHAVEVYYERRVDGATVTCGGRDGAWLRGGSLLTLLVNPQPATPTGSLFRRLRQRKLAAIEAYAGANA
jgi:hypothetical protein